MTTTTSPPTSALAWHTMRATARRILDTLDAEPLTDEVPRDLPINTRGDREKRRRFLMTLMARLATLEMVTHALALDVGSRKAARAVAADLAKTVTPDATLEAHRSEMLAAVRAFAGEVPNDG